MDEVYTLRALVPGTEPEPIKQDGPYYALAVCLTDEPGAANRAPLNTEVELIMALRKPARSARRTWAAVPFDYRFFTTTQRNGDAVLVDGVRTAVHQVGVRDGREAMARVNALLLQRSLVIRVDAQPIRSATAVLGRGHRRRLSVTLVSDRFSLWIRHDLFVKYVRNVQWQQLVLVVPDAQVEPRVIQPARLRLSPLSDPPGQAAERLRHGLLEAQWFDPEDNRWVQLDFMVVRRQRLPR